MTSVLSSAQAKRGGPKQGNNLFTPFKNLIRIRSTSVKKAFEHYGIVES